MTLRATLVGFAFITAALGVPAVQASTPLNQTISLRSEAPSTLAEAGAKSTETLARNDRGADDGANHEAGEHANGHEAGEHANGHEAGEHANGHEAGEHAGRGRHS